MRGAVTCTWLIPAKAKGKRFRAKASVTFEGLKASRSYSGRSGSSTPVRRLALVACLVAIVAATGVASSGTASGARDPVIESIRDYNFPRVQRIPAPPPKTNTPAQPRTRAILTLVHPPLAVAAPRSAFQTVGSRRKPSLRSSFSQSYLSA